MTLAQPPSPTAPWAHFTDGGAEAQGSCQLGQQDKVSPGLQTSSPFLSHAPTRPCKSWGHRFAQPTIAPLCWRGLRGGGAQGQTSRLLIPRPSPQTRGATASAPQSQPPPMKPLTRLWPPSATPMVTSYATSPQPTAPWGAWTRPPAWRARDPASQRTPQKTSRAR